MGEVRLERLDGVAVVTIDSPEVKNGLTPEMGDQFVALCSEIDADGTIGAAIVRGAGGTFCSGADRRRWIPGADQSEESTYRAVGSIYAAFMRFGSLQVPTIAAVRGAAVGAGLNLALAADLRIVAHDARLLAGFLKIGLHPGGGYYTISHRTAGREATSAMGIFNQQIDGRHAAAIGMAWESVDDDHVEARALELGAGAAADPALAREAIRSFRVETGQPGIPWEAALHFERSTQMWSQRRRNAS